MYVKCSQTFFEVVKEGRILNAGLLVILTKHHQLDSGSFWSILGHFGGLIEQKVSTK
jgi:hypothetical protein